MHYPETSQDEARRRVTIKRALRAAGYAIPRRMMYDTKALETLALRYGVRHE